MRVAQLVAQGAEAGDHRMAAREDLFEHLFGMIVRGEVQGLRQRPVKLRQVGSVVERFTGLSQDPFADIFQKGPRQGDGPLRIGLPAFERGLPASVHVSGIEGDKGGRNGRVRRRGLSQGLNRVDRAP
ncbi:hypothetical protein D3C72_2048940 [compost metagenome]